MIGNEIKITNELDIDFIDLCKVVDFSGQFTLRDIITAVNSSGFISRRVMMEILNCPYIKEYFDEMNKCPEDSITEFWNRENQKWEKKQWNTEERKWEEVKDEENFPMDYLEVSWNGYKSKYQDKIETGNSWRFDGIGKKGIKAYAKKGEKVNPNFREKYAIEFSPMYKLANYEIRMSKIMVISDSTRKGKIKYKNVELKFTPEITLIELLRAIFDELSMMGSIKQREEKKKMLNERVENIKSLEKNGGLKTVPWEEVKKKLLKKIEEVKKKQKETNGNN